MKVNDFYEWQLKCKFEHNNEKYCKPGQRCDRNKI